MPLAPFIAYVLNIRGYEPIFYFLFGSGCVIFTFLIFISNTQKFIIPRYIFPLFLLLIYYLGWDIVNETYQKAGFLSYFFRNITFYTIFVLLLIENTTFDYKFFSKMKVLIIATIIIGFCFTLYQVLVDYQFFIPQNIVYSFEVYGQNIWERRHTSIFAYLGSNEMGVSYIALLSIFIAMNSYKRNNTGRFYIYILIGSLIAVAGNARYVLFSLIIILSQIVIINKSFFKKFKTFIIVAFTILVLLFVLSILGYDISSYFNDRVFSKVSDSARINAFEVFLKEYPKEYLLGAGKQILVDISSVDLKNSAPLIHVGYLSHLYQYGLIGSFLLFWFWGLLIGYLYNKAKKVRFWGSFFAFFAFFFANTTFVYMNVFTYGLIIAIIYSKYYKPIYILSKREYDKLRLNNKNVKKTVYLN